MIEWRVGRRRLLGLLASLGAYAWTRGAVFASPQPDQRRARITRKLWGELRSPRSAAVVGAAYLARYPSERNVERLIADLGLDVSTLDELARRHRDDFAMGRVVRLSGFVLSRTELRLGALLHLLGEP